MNRRSFLKVGALFVPAAVAPTVAYSFLRAPTSHRVGVLIQERCVLSGTLYAFTFNGIRWVQTNPQLSRVGGST